MARGIVDCKNRVINVGDKVRTPTGRVIKVQGAAVAKEFFNAEACELVHHDVPTTEELHAVFPALASDPGIIIIGQLAVGKIAADAGDDPLDCVVWGT